jgi:16S rRNA G966 N2-methylase RsmD
MNEIVPSNVVTEIVAHRDAAMAHAAKAIQHMQDAQAAMDAASEHARTAHNDRVFGGLDRTTSVHYQRLFHPVDGDASLRAYRQDLDARVWMHLIERAGMDALMDRQAKEDFYRDLCGDVPEVTEDNVWSTLRGLAGDAKLIFQRGLARAFASLDHRFRSHDAFKLGSRVVLTNVFNEYGTWHYRGNMRETITDMERAFLVLDRESGAGLTSVGSLVQAIERQRGHGMSRRQGYVESDYFRVRTFKNGNAHLWFTRDDLVQKANETLADYYGAVLPDAVPDDVTGDSVRSYALSTDLAFYPTPSKVVETLMSMIRNTHGPIGRVLEPSAGDGAIVRALLPVSEQVFAIEAHPDRANTLRQMQSLPLGSRLLVQQANFLAIPARANFDLVVMNPPFCGTHWMAHVRHAFDFLKPGGTLLSVLPVSAELGETKKHEDFRAWAEASRGRCWGSMFSNLPAESFASSGTRISTVVLRLHKMNR